MKFQILVDAENFWGDLEKEMLGAKDYVYAQTMSFEGDTVGTMFSEAFQKSQATDKRLLLDSYIKAIISDKFLYSPKNLFSKPLRDEVKATHALIKKNRERNVHTRFTNPLGFGFLKIPIRNHKKLVAIDDRVAYIGGINFCDHNFHWHDMMLKIEDEAIASYLADDFRKAWENKHVGEA